jgi:hypothetical protein
MQINYLQRTLLLLKQLAIFLLIFFFVFFTKLFQSNSLVLAWIVKWQDSDLSSSLSISHLTIHGISTGMDLLGCVHPLALARGDAGGC